MAQRNRTDEIRKQRELRRTNAKKANIKKKKTPRKKKNSKAVSVFVSVGLVIALVLTVLSLTVFFKASHVTVKGESRYEMKQIITAADISPSQNMILLNKSKVEERIVTALPYIGNVDVKINLLTSTVTLIVSETEPFGAVRYGEEYLLIDSKGKFLEQVKSPTCTKIYVEKIETPKIGKPLNFSDADTLKNLLILVEKLEELSIKDITAIDLSNSSDIRLLYKDMQIWKLGTKAVLSSPEELEYKLKFCIKLSQNEEGKQGVADVSTMTLADTTKYGFFREEVVIPEEFGVIPEPIPETPTDVSDTESDSEESSVDESDETEDDGEYEENYDDSVENEYEDDLDDEQNDL